MHNKSRWATQFQQFSTIYKFIQGLRRDARDFAPHGKTNNGLGSSVSKLILADRPGKRAAHKKLSTRPASGGSINASRAINGGARFAHLFDRLEFGPGKLKLSAQGFKHAKRASRQGLFFRLWKERSGPAPVHWRGRRGGGAGYS